MTYPEDWNRLKFEIEQDKKLWKTATMFSVFWALDLLKPMQDGFANEADHASRLKAWLSEAETKHLTFKKAGPNSFSPFSSYLQNLQNVSENVSVSIFWHPFLSTIRIDRFFQLRHPSHQCYDVARPPVCWMPICGLWKRSCRPGPAQKVVFHYGVGHHLFLPGEKYWWKFENYIQADGTS